MTTITAEQVLALASQLPLTEQRWVTLRLQEQLRDALPSRATLEEAIELYLADACSLARAAELAKVSRWDLLDALKARGAMQHPVDFRSADEMDDVLDRLEQQGVL